MSFTTVPSTVPSTSEATRLRVAFVGKGGAGKSAIAGTFARLLSRAGHPVLALDSDPMPGLAFSVGVANIDEGIPADAVVERAEGEDGPRFRLRIGLSPLDAVDAFSITGPDGVRFLQFGKIAGPLGGAMMRSQVAFRQIVSDLPRDRWNLVGDLPGGTRQPFFGWADFADTVIVVAEPSVKGILSARRLARLARPDDAPGRIQLVLNKVRDDDDVARIGERVGLPVLAAVPWDEALAAAEQRGLAPLDEAPESPAVDEVASLVASLISMTSSQSTITKGR